MKVIRLSTALLLLAVVTIGLVSIPQWQKLHDANERADDRSAAMAVATQEVRDLTTLSPTTLDPTLERLKKRLTGTFARQFDAFYSTNPSTGTGLGLAIVKKIVDMNGGAIDSSLSRSS